MDKIDPKAQDLYKHFAHRDAYSFWWNLLIPTSQTVHDISKTNKDNK